MLGGFLEPSQYGKTEVDCGEIYLGEDKIDGELRVVKSAEVESIWYNVFSSLKIKFNTRIRFKKLM